MRLRNALVACVIALALGIGWTSTAMAEGQDDGVSEEEAPPVDSAPPSDVDEDGAEDDDEEGAAEEDY